MHLTYGILRDFQVVFRLRAFPAPKHAASRQSTPAHAQVSRSGKTLGDGDANRQAVGLRQVVSIAASTSQQQEHNRIHERAKQAAAHCTLYDPRSG